MRDDRGGRPGAGALRAVAIVAAVAACGGGVRNPRIDGAPAENVPIVVVPQIGGPAAMSAQAMSADGKYVITSREDTLELWEIATGSLLRSFRDVERVGGLAFAPDSRHVLSSNAKGQIRMWDVTRGEVVRTFERAHGESNVRALAISPDGRRALSAGRYDSKLVLWDLGTGRSLRTAGVGMVDVVAISPDGKHALVGGSAYSEGEHALALWDLESGVRVRGFTMEKRQSVLAIAFSPDGRTALTATLHPSDDRLPAMTLWNVATGTPARTFELGEGPAYERLGIRTFAVAFSHDGKRALSSASPAVDRLGQALYLWDVATGALIRRFRGDTDWMHSAAFLPDGKHAIAGSEIWELESGARVRAMPALHRPNLRSVTFSPNGRYVLSSGTNLHLWDLRTGALARLLGTEMGGVAAFLPDSRRVLASTAEGYGSGMRLIDVETGEVVHTFPEHEKGITGIAVTGDGRRAVTTDHHHINVWDLETRTLVRSMPDPYGLIAALAISPDGKRAIVASHKRPGLEVIDLDAGTVVAGYHLHDASYIQSVAFTPDGMRGVSASWDKTVKVWDVATGNVVHTFSGHTRYVDAVAITPDGKRAISGGHDDVLRVWDAATGAPIATLAGHGAGIRGLAVSPRGKHAASVSSDGTMRLWNLDAMSPRASVAMVASGSEWLAYTSDGFFDASRRGGALVAAVSGMRAFRIDQLAARYNRPDEILRVLGLGDVAVVEHFRARYLMRLQKLGLRADQLASSFASAPDVRIAHATTAGSFVDLTIDLAGRGASLLRYNVFVNEIPLHGPLGKPVTGRSQRVRERIELLPGRNKIEVGVIDERGAESLRDMRVFERADKVQGDLYVLAFGVSRYRDPQLNLGYAHKDALDIAATFARTKGTAFREVHVKAYTDAQVTTDAIRTARQHFARAKAADTAIVFIAGHGVHATDATADYYYATHDVDPRRLRETAAPFALVESLLSEIAPRRKLLLIDTCESGEREEGATAIPTAGGRELRARAVRALVRREERAAPPRPRPHLLERERFIYNDLARRTGAIVFSSSRGSELSYEHDAWANGAFTAELKLALTTSIADTNHDGAVSIDELKRYVSDAVAKRTMDRQHPTIDRDNVEMQLALPIAR